MGLKNHITLFCYYWANIGMFALSCVHSGTVNMGMSAFPCVRLPGMASWCVYNWTDDKSPAEETVSLVLEGWIEAKAYYH
jgi:hypothetical protein